MSGPGQLAPRGAWEDSPSPVVQVDDECVVPKLLEGLVVMAVHVPCGDKPAGSLREARRRALPPRPASVRGAVSMSTAAAAEPELGARWAGRGPWTYP